MAELIISLSGQQDLSVGRYVVFYRATTEGIQVVRIVSGEGDIHSH